MRNALAVVLISGLMVSSARADIKVVRSVDTETGAGFGSSQREMTLWISGDKHREEQKPLGKPSMLEKMAGVGRPVITRLDKKLRWTLNAPKKTYQEQPLVVPVPESKKEEVASPEESTHEEKPTMKITKAEFKVAPLNQKKTIGVYACEGYQLRTLLETENLGTHERSEMKMITILWTTPESGAVAQLKKEEEAYAKAHLNAIGITDSARTDLQAIGGAMIAALAGSGEKELSKAMSGMPAEMKKIKGYPILTRVEWYSKEDAATAEGSDEAAGDAEIPADVSSALGNFAAGFAKKKMEAKKPAPSAEGRLMLALTTEIQSIETTALPADTFEVPAGFKKTK